MWLVPILLQKEITNSWENINVSIYLKILVKKEIAMIKEPDEVFDIIQRADCSKEIKIFEKQNKWQLVYHVKDGKTQLNNIFKNAKKNI